MAVVVVVMVGVAAMAPAAMAREELAMALPVVAELALVAAAARRCCQNWHTWTLVDCLQRYLAA